MAGLKRYVVESVGALVNGRQTDMAVVVYCACLPDMARPGREEDALVPEIPDIAMATMADHRHCGQSPRWEPCHPKYHEHRVRIPSEES